MSFDSLGLNPDILRAVAEQGYREPTPIQQQAIPAVLEGRDLMASAQTGTGKTAGFTLPLLQHLITHQPHAKGRRPVRALILTPTRELAAQIGENVRDYSKYLNIRSLVVFGGVSINPQMMKLRSGVDVLVATPGRLLDLEHQNAVKLIRLRSRYWMKRTVCWIWALSMIFVAYWLNCPLNVKTCCSPQRFLTTLSRWQKNCCITRSKLKLRVVIPRLSRSASSFTLWIKNVNVNCCHR